MREVRYNSADQTTDVLDFFYAYDGSPYAMKYNNKQPTKAYTPKYPLPMVPNKAAQDRDKYRFNKSYINTGSRYTPAMRKKLTVMERRLDP